MTLSLPGDVETRVLRHAARHDLLPRGAMVICAVSGGADSMTLLAWLSSHAEALGIEVAAAHLDHRLPEARSDEAAACVRRVCERQGIPLHVATVDVAARARRWGLGIEAAGRRARQTWFRRLAYQHGARLATAHTADDQAETVLMRLLRGSGPRGLRAILPRMGNPPWLVRPFLPVGRAATRAAAAQAGLDLVEDPTNDDVAYNRRNRIRGELLPLLAERYNPRVVEALCRLADAARDDEAALEEGAAQAWRVHATEQETVVLADDIRALPASLRARLYRRAVEVCQGGDLDAAGVGRLEDLLFGERGRRSRAGGIEAIRTSRGLELAGTVQRPPAGIGAGIPLLVPGEVRVAGWKVRAWLVDGPGERDDRRGRMDDGYRNAMRDPWHAVLPATAVPLLVRGRRPGDRWRPPRGSGSCKLKATLNAWRVPATERDAVPLVTYGDAIACLPGWGVDDGYARPDLPTPVVQLEIVFEEEEPTDRRAQ